MIPAGLILWATIWTLIVFGTMSLIADSEITRLSPLFEFHNNFKYNNVCYIVDEQIVYYLGCEST
jgi:hypothetical protein